MSIHWALSATKNGQVLLLDSQFSIVHTLHGMRPRGLAKQGDTLYVAFFNHWSAYSLLDFSLKQECTVGTNNHDILANEASVQVVSVPGGLIAENSQASRLASPWFVNTMHSRDLYTIWNRRANEYCVVHNGEMLGGFNQPHHALPVAKSIYVADSGSQAIVSLDRKDEYQHNLGYARSLVAHQSGMLFTVSPYRSSAGYAGIAYLDLATGQSIWLKAFEQYKYLYQLLKL